MWGHNFCSLVECRWLVLLGKILFCKLIIYKVYKGSAKIWLNNFQNMNRYYVQRIKLHQKTIWNLFISLYKTLLIQIIISRGLKMLDRASQENFPYFINCEWYLPFFSLSVSFYRKEISRIFITPRHQLGCVVFYGKKYQRTNEFLTQFILSTIS